MLWQYVARAVMFGSVSIFSLVRYLVYNLMRYFLGFFVSSSFVRSLFVSF